MDRRDRARRAYERGRVRFAVGRAAPALAFGLAALLLAGDRGIGLAVSVGLAIVSGGLVFVGGPSGRAVPAALLAGWVPFALPLLVRGQVCPLGGSCEAWCVAACAAGGTLAGAWLGWRSSSQEGGAWWLITGVVLASTAGALGCSCVGVPGLTGMAAGSMLAATVVRRLSLLSAGG